MQILGGTAWGETRQRAYQIIQELRMSTTNWMYERARARAKALLDVSRLDRMRRKKYTQHATDQHAFSRQSDFHRHSCGHELLTPAQFRCRKRESARHVEVPERGSGESF